MFNTGQSCDAPTRLLVERSCYDQVVEIATRAAKATRVGDPTEEGDHIGPLFDQIQFDRVQTMIQVGIDVVRYILVTICILLNSDQSPKVLKLFVK